LTPTANGSLGSPYEAGLVDALIGGRLEDGRPREAIARIAPRPVLLIHCREDDNATTPFADAQAMFDSHAPGERKQLFAVSGCAHAGAFPAHPDAYRSAVLTFLAEAFR